MAKTKISEYDASAGNNTDVNSVNIAEGCAPSGINNAIREVMAALKRFQTGADGDALTVGGNLVVSGTTGANTFTGTVVNATTVDTTNIEVTNIKAKDGTAAASIADSTGKITVSTELAVDNLNLSVNTISSTDTNGNIVLAPNGTGDVQVDADTLRVGDSGADATIQSNGNADLILKTGNATTGTMTLADGANGNLTVALNGTGQIVVNAGAVGTPTIAPTSDLNTGIFFPAADTIAFAEGGAEAMRIDSSGNVGIGTSSPAGKLTLSNGGTYAPSLSGQMLTLRSGAGVAYMTMGNGDGADSYRYIGGASATQLFGKVSDAGTVTEHMRIDSSGNVGIGTSSPSTRLSLQLSSATTYTTSTRTNQGLTIYNSSATTNGFTGIEFAGEPTSGNGGFAGIGSVVTGSGSANLVFGTRDSATYAERMRITSGGEVYIAGTTDQGAYNLQCNGTGVWGAGAYVNGSDERLKDNITSIDSGLDVVTAMRPVTFTYKEDYSKDQSIQTGFIAQELQQAMSGKNYVDGIVQAGPEYLNVAYQNLIPILTKAIQELKAENDALKARLDAAGL